MGKELQVVAPTPGDTLSLTFCKSNVPAKLDHGWSLSIFPEPHFQAFAPAAPST